MAINQVTVFNNLYQPQMGCGCLPTYMPGSCSVFPQTPMMSVVPPMPMTPMVPMVPVAPMMPMYPMNDPMAAGFGFGMLMGMPGAAQALGDGLRWGYNNLIKPVWNGVVKPVWNEVVKPTLNFVGKGLKWVWDHTLGWVFKKVGGAIDASNAKEAERKAEAEAEAAEEAAEAAEEAAEEADEE